MRVWPDEGAKVRPDRFMSRRWVGGGGGGRRRRLLLFPCVGFFPLVTNVNDVLILKCDHDGMLGSSGAGERFHLCFFLFFLFFLSF